MSSPNAQKPGRGKFLDPERSGAATGGGAAQWGAEGDAAAPAAWLQVSEGLLGRFGLLWVALLVFWGRLGCRGGGDIQGQTLRLN